MCGRLACFPIYLLTCNTKSDHQKGCESKYSAGDPAAAATDENVLSFKVHSGRKEVILWSGGPLTWTENVCLCIPISL